MKIKKQCKLKSASRIRYYKSFGWLGIIAYRLHRDNEGQIRKYLKTGKYVETYGEPYGLVEDLELMVKDIYISSTVKRSRIKNKPGGCVCI